MHQRLLVDDSTYLYNWTCITAPTLWRHSIVWQTPTSLETKAPFYNPFLTWVFCWCLLISNWTFPYWTGSLWSFTWMELGRKDQLLDWQMAHFGYQATWYSSKRDYPKEKQGHVFSWDVVYKWRSYGKGGRPHRMPKYYVTLFVCLRLDNNNAVTSLSSIVLVVLIKAVV